MPADALGSPELCNWPSPAGWVQSAQALTPRKSRPIGRLLLDSDKWLSITPTCTGLPPPSLDSGKHLVSVPGSLARVCRWDGWEEARRLGKTPPCSRDLGPVSGPWISRMLVCGTRTGWSLCTTTRPHALPVAPTRTLILMLTSARPQTYQPSALPSRPRYLFSVVRRSKPHAGSSALREGVRAQHRS